MQVICQVCGKSFEAKKRNAKYCSNDCRRYNPKLEVKQCIICGKEFKQRNTKQKTCGNTECKHKFNLTQKKNGVYKYNRYSGIEKKVKPIKTRYTKTKWNKLTAEERWRNMSLFDCSVACTKYHITYGQADSMFQNKCLPEDFGKRE